MSLRVCPTPKTELQTMDHLVGMWIMQRLVGGMEVGSIIGNSALMPQFYYEPKTALKLFGIKSRLQNSTHEKILFFFRAFYMLNGR